MWVLGLNKDVFLWALVCQRLAQQLLPLNASQLIRAPCVSRCWTQGGWRHHISLGVCNRENPLVCGEVVIDRAKWAEPSGRCPEGLQHRDMAEPFLRVLVPGLLRLAPGF